MSFSRNSTKAARARSFHDDAFVQMLRKILKDPEIGKLMSDRPDEARTFGMESLFRTVEFIRDRQSTSLWT